jgi:glycerol-3-phosphate dehydrogenase
MGGTKGSHLVLDKKDLREALGDRMVYYEHNDGRVCIIFGFLDKVIMGSTDIPLEDPDEAACDEAEMAYMLETLQGVFPGVKVAPHEVVFKFCGVRPLPRTGEGIPGKVTRNHRIEVLEPGALRPYPVHCLIGGKWTTFRALAEEAAGGILPALGRQRMRSTAHEPIGGGRGFPSSDAQKAQWIKNTAAATGADAGRLSILLGRYGTRAEDCARQAGAGIRRPLESLPDHTAGEIEWIAENDLVVHLTDLVCRRTLIALLGQARRRALEEIAGIAGAVLGWDPVRRAAEVDLALREVAV